MLTRLFNALRVASEISATGMIPWAAAVFLGPKWFIGLPGWGLLVAFLVPLVSVGLLASLFSFKVKYEETIDRYRTEIGVPESVHTLRVWSIWVAGTFGVLSTFAITYWALSLRNPEAFNEPLSLSSAVYFTLTTFTTTGFGDISARSDVARLTVAVQMLIGLALVAVGLAIVVGYYARRLQEPPDLGQGPGETST